MKQLVAALSLLLVLLAACSSGMETSETGNPTETPVPTEIAVPTDVPEPTAAPKPTAVVPSASADPSRIPNPAPAVGDHWHAVYGVFDCTVNDGRGGYLPAFQSQLPGLGIHSHGDGIVHVHPNSPEATGQDARLEHFLTAMQVILDDDRIVLDNAQVLDEGADCNGQPAVVHVRKWQFSFQAQSGEDPQVFTEDLDQLQFLNDREVYIIVFAPLDADVPLPPNERFDRLAEASPFFESA